MSSNIKVESTKCTKEEADRIVDIVEDAYNQCESNADRAKEIKMNLDKAFNDVWQCIVGKNFATYVTHEEDKFCHLKIGTSSAVQVFKAGI